MAILKKLYLGARNTCPGIRFEIIADDSSNRDIVHSEILSS